MEEALHRSSLVNNRIWGQHDGEQALASEPCAAECCSLQIYNGLSTAASLQLLHDQVGLDAQQQRLTGYALRADARR